MDRLPGLARPGSGGPVRPSLSRSPASPGGRRASLGPRGPCRASGARQGRSGHGPGRPGRPAWCAQAPGGRAPHVRGKRGWRPRLRAGEAALAAPQLWPQAARAQPPPRRPQGEVGGSEPGDRPAWALGQGTRPPGPRFRPRPAGGFAKFPPGAEVGGSVGGDRGLGSRAGGRSLGSRLQHEASRSGGHVLLPGAWGGSRGRAAEGAGARGRDARRCTGRRGRARALRGRRHLFAGAAGPASSGHPSREGCSVWTRAWRHEPGRTSAGSSTDSPGARFAARVRPLARSLAPRGTKACPGVDGAGLRVTGGPAQRPPGPQTLSKHCAHLWKARESAEGDRACWSAFLALGTGTERLWKTRVF